MSRLHLTVEFKRAATLAQVRAAILEVEQRLFLDAAPQWRVRRDDAALADTGLVTWTAPARPNDTAEFILGGTHEHVRRRMRDRSSRLSVVKTVSLRRTL